MKKILLIFLLIITLGCENNFNTPTSKVESFLGQYQKLDNKVLNNLDIVIKNNKNLNKKQKNIYKNLLQRQYQNLSYKIKNEEIDNNIAIVTAEIEVLDYASSIKKSKEYYLNHQEEFTNKNYNDYKLKELKNTKDKTKYEMSFYLTKNKGIWELNDMDKEDRKKLHGLY